jgi:hypothetical protein
MMKIARLLCALWVCGPLALDARAADSLVRNGAAVAPAKLGQAAGSATDGRDKGIKTTTQAGSSKGDGPKGRNAAVAASPRRGSVTAPRAAGPLARSNADRLRSLHPAKARGGIASTPNRRVGPKVAATSSNVSAAGRGIPGSHPQALPMRPVAVGADRVSPSAKAMVRGSAIGGPRAAAGPGQLGGPATGRTAHNTAIDGTQVRHKT